MTILFLTISSINAWNDYVLNPRTDIIDTSEGQTAAEHQFVNIDRLQNRIKQGKSLTESVIIQK